MLVPMAAGQSLDPKLEITQYVHDAWTVEDGLPQNTVYDVEQGPDGYLWVGTQAGLARFDGIRFELFDTKDGLGSNEVRALLTARDGSLWIGTNGGGLSRLREGEFTTFTTDEGLPNDVVRALYEDREGSIWIGTIGGGLSRYDGSTFSSYSTEDGLAGDVVLSIDESPTGALWIGTQAGLSRYHNGEFQTYTENDGLPGNVVWALEPGDSDGYWIGTSGGIAYLKDGRVVRTYTLPDGLCGETAAALHLDAHGALWVGTLGGGLCRVMNGRLESFSEIDGLTHDFVRSLMSDREGSLWIATESGGLNRLRQGKFIHITSHEGLSDDMAMAVVEDARGELWIGTKGGGLNRVKSNNSSSQPPSNAIARLPGLPEKPVYALHRSGNFLWIGMYGGGLCRWDGETLKCFGADDGLPTQNVFSVLEAADGTAWIGTEAGLYMLKNGVVTPALGDDRLAQSAITIVHQDRSGSIWAGIYGGGLARISGGHLDFPDVSDATVLAIYETEDGSLWAATYGGGLCRIRNENSSCLTSDQGLPGDQVLQVLVDDVGGLWVGTQQGISRLSLDEAEAVLDGRSDAVHAVHFTKADGLKSTEVNGGTQPSAWKGRDGRLWFATNRGVAGIDPSHIPTNPVPPPVVIERVYANGDVVGLGGIVELPPGSRDVAFRYTALSFTAPESVRFEYMLEGYDDDWIEARSRREAYYTNLPPGEYRFVVRAANSDGVWNKEGASLQFELLPYFYQTSWFKLLCVLLALLSGFAAYRFRVRQLKARERELTRMVEDRTRDLRAEKDRTEKAKKVIEGQAEKLRELDRFKTQFFANVSHEFRTPLTMIIGPLESMLTGVLEAGIARQQVEVMYRNAMRLMRLINQLLDLSKLEDGKMKLKTRRRDIVSFLEGIVISCTGFAERKGVQLDFESADEALSICYEPDKLEKIFFNLLSNAIKFTPAGGRISVELVRTGASDEFPDGALHVAVRDSGKGIPADQLPHIFDRFHQVDGSNTREHEGTGIGLALAKELILLHRGTVEVKSELGVGTEFLVALPLGTAHLNSDELASGDDEFVADEGALTELATSDFNFIHDDETSFYGDGADVPVQTTFGSASSGADAPQTDNVEPTAPLILIVDDNKDVREYVASVLSDEYRIAMGRDGADGLDKMREVDPDLILSDVMMPNVDGNALCRAVKSSPEFNHIPVILLTARATHELKMEGLEVGADDYIPKPFNVHELKVRIRNLLRLRHQEKELKELNDNLEAKVQEQFQIVVAERERYESDLIAAKERAEASDRLKTAILNNLSHEVRTPLTAIMGFNDIIAMEASNDLSEFTREIDRGSRRLLRTLDSLIELSRLESEGIQAPAEPVALSDLTGVVAERYRNKAAEKGLSLEVSFTAAAAVLLDASAVDEILDNLIDNAVKFTGAGGIIIEVDAADSTVVVSVRDTGVGIGEEFLPQIYDAFKQESDGFTRDFEGVGLGLTISKRLVELLGGTIDVASTKGKGSEFTVRFPAAGHSVAA